MEARDTVLTGHCFFDKKPLIVRPWSVDMDMEKEEVQVIPIWIQLRLNFKYWGEKALFKIVGQIGKPVKRDSATINRDKLDFARVMVEVPMNQKLPESVSFVNEHGMTTQVELRYEWRPTLCVNVQPVHQVRPQEVEVDQEGFQRALRPIRVRVSSVEPTQTANPFQLLNDEQQEQVSPQLQDSSGDHRCKQSEVCRFIQQHGIGLVGLLEHKVKLPNLGKLYQKIFSSWCFTSNSSFHSGGRIIVAWNPGSFTVSILSVTAQHIHCLVAPMSGMPAFFCTFVYAFNDSKQRERLWSDLRERIGSAVRQSEIADINACMHCCSMEDIKSSGHFFTWNNKQEGANRVFSKLDRVLANPKWVDSYSAAEVCFLSEGAFDHSPGLLTVYPKSNGGKKPFKYFTMWKSAPKFGEIVKTQWDRPISGSKMFVVVSKLKRVKLALKELNKTGFSDVHAADLKAYHDLLAAQEAMHLHPDDHSLANEELDAIKTYKDKHQVYLDFLRQKAKVEWIKSGDENTTLFHQSIKRRNLQNQVYSIHDKNGVWRDNPTEVTSAFLEYYECLLGGNSTQRAEVLSHIVQTGPLVTDAHRAILNAPYTREEVKSALWSIPGVKAPGPDGFGSFFYRDAWHIVGDDVIAAVLDVLQSGKLLKELNHTVITLIPKTKCPKNVSEYRPISCCNTLYKCVTKVLCGRMRQILPDLIQENQGGFVHGRYIVHNIMVIQDLVKQYGRKSVKPSCLMKIDLQKAYDTVDWGFLKSMLEQLGFPTSFVQIVMECVTTPMFSLMVNGSMQGFFKSKRGLR
ncbi:uncharacterized protein [Spinacia oleracea]|uniref:Reverse transcriptase domain-containing protein n=1 Tax=Spinacia oleracea TaxID=3562 RepID=A0ABM3RQ08_SPIOL|nr:uncharacterized protein LOC130471535 [Spinacia oleracea]